MLKMINVKEVLFSGAINLFRIFFDKSHGFGLSSQISVLVGKVINNHRMSRWEVQEGSSGDHLIHPPNSQQGQLEQIAQSRVHPGFK